MKNKRYHSQPTSMFNSPVIGLINAALLPPIFSVFFILPLYMIKGNENLYYCTKDVKAVLGVERFRVLECEVVTCLLPIKHVEVVYNGNLN